MSDISAVEELFTSLQISADNRVTYSESNEVTGLDLSNLGLSEVPDEIYHLQNLRQLDLSGNEFTEIPEFPYYRLRHVDLSDNYIRSFEYLPNTNIRLDKNPLIMTQELVQTVLDVYLDGPSGKSWKIHQFVGPITLECNAKFGRTNSGNKYSNTYYDAIVGDRPSDEELKNSRLVLEFSEPKMKKFIDTGLTLQGKSNRNECLKLYSYFFGANQPELPETSILDRLGNSFFFLYLVAGVSIVFLGKSVFPDAGKFISGEFSFLLIGLYFGFQFYQGLTIKEYANSLVSKFEIVGDFLKKFDDKLASVLYSFILKLRSSFGVLITVFIFVSLTSVEESIERTTAINYSQYMQVDLFSSFFDFLDTFIISFEGLITPFSSLLPEIPWLEHLVIVSEFLSLSLRAVGILTIFYSVFQGGWQVIIFPTRIEDRERGAKLDWYEILALPLGLVVVFIAEIVNRSVFREIPVTLLLIGVILGGITYIIFDKVTRYQIIYTSITFATLLGIRYILLNGLTPIFGPRAVAAFEFIFIHFGMIEFYIAVGLVFLWINPHNFFYSRGQPGIYTILGHPHKKGEKGWFLWRITARVGGFRYDQESIFNDSFFDLASFIVFFELNIALPLLLIFVIMYIPLEILLGLVGLSYLIILILYDPKLDEDENALRYPWAVGIITGFILGLLSGNVEDFFLYLLVGLFGISLSTMALVMLPLYALGKILLPIINIFRKIYSFIF